MIFDILIGDSNKKLDEITPESVDCIISDPPYGISYLQNTWDKNVPGSDVWSKCLSVLKPGGFAFVMSSPRQDVLSRMIMNMDNAGFNVAYTSIYWTYSSGFPKARSLSSYVKGAFAGYNPKPAVEVVLVCMKPLKEKNYKSQLLANQKGCTWFNDCRIPISGYESEGRYPANLLVSDDVLNDGRIFKSTASEKPSKKKGFFVRPGTQYVEIKKTFGDSGSYSKYFDLDEWFKQRYAELPNDVRTVFPYLIVSKPSSREKNTGVENTHPTVKPIKLMSYLVTLGSRENDTVLDPFCGSGSTGIAATMLGRKFIGIELNREFADIAKKRIKAFDKNKFSAVPLMMNPTEQPRSEFYC